MKHENEPRAPHRRRTKEPILRPALKGDQAVAAYRYAERVRRADDAMTNAEYRALARFLNGHKAKAVDCDDHDGR